MAWDINNVLLIGRLTKDPEIRYTKSGLAVCPFSIAVNGKAKRDESSDNEVSFFDIVSFGPTAENCHKYLQKGRQVAVGGYLRQNRWEDQNGQKRYKIEIIADKIQFIGGSANQSPNNTQRSTEQTDSGDFNAPFPEDDDIPF